MKNQTTSNYARVLYELVVPMEIIEQSDQIFADSEELLHALTTPIADMEEKYRIIDRIFPEEIRSFLKVTCRNQYINHIRDIFAAYKEYCQNAEGVINAELLYVASPEDEQAEKMKAFIQKKYGKKNVILKMTEDKSLLGGFILRVGSDEYDWSMKGRLTRLEQKLTWR